MDESIQISYNTEKDISQKNIKIENSFANLTLSDIGGGEKKDEMNSSNSIIFNTKIEDFNNIFPKAKKSRIKKEELNNIPIPIFSCIYCSNEKVSFNHMIKEILEKKYFLLTSIYDIKQINKMLLNKNIPSLIVDNREYIKKYYKYKEAKILLNIRLKVKNSNFTLDNKINNIYITNKSTSSNSTYTKFKFEDLMKEQSEKKNKSSYNKRKITKKDIKWDAKYYNIWNPIPEPIYTMPHPNFSSSKSKDDKNKTPMMLRRKKILFQISSKIKVQKIENSNKKYKNKIPTFRNEKLKANKTFQKLYYKNNCTKKSSKNKNLKNLYDKNSITKLITRSNSKNKTHNIIVNIEINKTPIKNKINKTYIKKINKTTNKENIISSTKNMLLKTKNISLNKIKKNYLNINTLNIFKSAKNILKEKPLSKKRETSYKKKINTKLFSLKKSKPKTNQKYMNKINILTLFKKKIKKQHLSNQSSKKISRNNTHNKIEKKQNIFKVNTSSEFFTDISSKNKKINLNIYIDKSSKFKNKNIEIHMK